MEDRLRLQEGRQQNPETEVEQACLTMRRWPQSRAGLARRGGCELWTMGCEPCRVGTEVWPPESSANMSVDGGDSGKLGVSLGSRWPSKQLLGNGETSRPGASAS